MGARAGFGVALKAEGWLICAMNTLQRAIKQRAMGGAQAVWQSFLIDSKAVVLASNHDNIVVYIFYRMIGTMVTELHLHCLGTGG